MSTESKIISAIMQDRSAFATVQSYYEASDLSDLGDLIYQEVALYYKRDGKVRQCDKSCILERLERKYTKHTDKFKRVISRIRAVSIDNVLEDYRQVKRKAAAEKAGSYLMVGDYEKAAPLLEKLASLEDMTKGNDSAPIVYQDAEADDFCEALELKNRIPIAPKKLNDHLGGGLIAGCHVLIYAPPECGKTALAINIAYSIAASGRVCMYFGNEESAEMYLNRMLCRFCRWPLNKVLKDKKAAMVLARTRGWKNLIFVYCSPGSIGQVQELILKKKPDVVVIDQLSNLTLGRGQEPEKTQLLEKLAYVMRIFYARNKIAGISMSQADEKAIGTLYLTIKNVYYSNIGVQGMCDVMIGMGMNDEYERMGRRVLNITKNKLGGTHEAIHVQLMNEISMLKGI